jgi:glycyl-tRNA synthetase
LEFTEVRSSQRAYSFLIDINAGVSGLFDYGPPGCALQANILDYWRKHFVLEEDMLELDTTILTPHDVLKTSGHVDRFSDLMCKDLKTGDIFRVDHLVEGELERRLEADAQARRPGTKKPKGDSSATTVLLTDKQKDAYKNILAQVSRSLD